MGGVVPILDGVPLGGSTHCGVVPLWMGRYLLWVGSGAGGV